LKLGQSLQGPAGFSPTAMEWVSLDGIQDQGLLPLLADHRARAAVEERLAAPADGVVAPPRGLPFAPRSLRAFAIWESHMVNGARGMVRAFAPAPLRALVRGYESVTRTTFPALKPKANYYRHPQFYMGNHRSVLTDHEEVEWPSFSSVLDFELELGFVLMRSVRDCTPDEGRAAIGGFVVINDWSARDTQWEDTRRGAFGGVVKAKTFASSMSSVLVTADEVLPRFDQLRGRVRVNDETWCEGSTANALYDPGELVAYASRGETLSAGDLLSTGTLPGCCGLELGRFPQPDDRVQLEIDGIGTLTNTITRAGL
jgi:2-keto-4-pentenoate hydratase/2-oxohepta-3-ene-1,7-dioic acid hydratase in catechol pathway